PASLRAGAARGHLRRRDRAGADEGSEGTGRADRARRVPEGRRVAAVARRAAARLPRGGTVTAGKPSGSTDGRASVILPSGRAARTAGVTPGARIAGYATAGVDPAIMGIGPVPAIRALESRTGVALDRIDLVELNEAFAAQVLACDRELHFDRARL